MSSESNFFSKSKIRSEVGTKPSKKLFRLKDIEMKEMVERIKKAERRAQEAKHLKKDHQRIKAMKLEFDTQKAQLKKNKIYKIKRKKYDKKDIELQKKILERKIKIKKYQNWQKNWFTIMSFLVGMKKIQLFATHLPEILELEFDNKKKSKKELLHASARAIQNFWRLRQVVKKIKLLSPNQKEMMR